jgi:outer membrane protein assembly factor BamB
MRVLSRALAIVAVASCSVAVFAQGRGGQNWNTTNADAQRTGWIRTETRISATSVQQTGPNGFQLLWKVRPEMPGAQQAGALTQPVILQNLISHKGFKALLFVGKGDAVWAYDFDLAKPYWSSKLDVKSSQPGTTACPAGWMSLTRSTALAQSAIPGAPPSARAGGAAPAPAPGGGRGPAVGINPNNLPIANAVWAVSSAGTLHALNPHVGGDLRTPVKLVPPGAKVIGSVLVDNVLYAATSDRCAGVPNGVWTADLRGDTPAMLSWDAKGASIVGAGPTLGLNNLLYVATGASAAEPTYANAIVALDPLKLEVRDSFTAEAPFTTSPVAFAFRGRDLVAAANADGWLYLLDAGSLGGADRRSPLTRTASNTVGAGARADTLASWEDPDGTRWILAASRSAIAAFRLVEQAGAFALQSAWTSREMVMPLSPIVLNDVVFALANGPRQASAVLYALDGKSGKELWNSGDNIPSAATVTPSGQDGQVYVSAADGTLYAFGLPLER